MGSEEWFYDFLLANRADCPNILEKFSKEEILLKYRRTERERREKMRKMKNEEGGSEGKDAAEEETSTRKKVTAQKKRKARLIEAAAKNLSLEQTLDQDPQQIIDQAMKFVYPAYKRRIRDIYNRINELREEIQELRERKIKVSSTSLPTEP